METLWNRIKAVLQEIAPELLKQLNPGISQKEIEILEAAIGTKLPEDMVAFYKVHNGQDRESAGLINGEELLSLERVYDEWFVWKDLSDNGTFEEDKVAFRSEPENGIKNDWWNPKWIPVTYNGSGDHICIDLDPAAEGKKGQMIRMWHDARERSLESGSFKEWIENYVHLLESGQMVYDEDYFGIYNKEDL